ncbi:MAG TPA: hypothetical protein VGM00_14280 [Bradyrhizobium sp.]|jgi:hypothetical protein
MTTNASGCVALIIATGLFVGLAGPSQAATDSDADAATATAEAPAGAPVKLSKFTKHASHHWKRHAHTKVMQKSAPDKPTADAADGDADNSPAVQPAAIPTSVANANAQLAAPDTPAAAPDTPADNAKAMTERANTIVQSTADAPVDAQPANDPPVVAPDQLNDVDRSLRDSAPPAATLAAASAEPPAAEVAPAANSEPSAWDQTSLIGKIFIGFGALLTMASAARMFMA